MLEFHDDTPAGLGCRNYRDGFSFSVYYLYIYIYIRYTSHGRKRRAAGELCATGHPELNLLGGTRNS